MDDKLICRWILRFFCNTWHWPKMILFWQETQLDIARQRQSLYSIQNNLELFRILPGNEFSSSQEWPWRGPHCYSCSFIHLDIFPHNDLLSNHFFFKITFDLVLAESYAQGQPTLSRHISHTVAVKFMETDTPHRVRSQWCPPIGGWMTPLFMRSP